MLILAILDARFSNKFIFDDEREATSEREICLFTKTRQPGLGGVRVYTKAIKILMEKFQKQSRRRSRYTVQSKYEYKVRTAVRKLSGKKAGNSAGNLRKRNDIYIYNYGVLGSSVLLLNYIGHQLKAFPLQNFSLLEDENNSCIQFVCIPKFLVFLSYQSLE